MTASISVPDQLVARGSVFLRWVAGYSLDGIPPCSERADPLPSEPLGLHEWNALLRDARHEGLLGFLASALADVVFPATDEQAAQAHDAHVTQLCGDLLRERELVDIALLLERAHIEHRVLKGSAVAHLDYPDPGLRSFTDVDLLVRSEQWDEAIAVLARAGWSRQFQEPRPGFDRRFGKGVVLTRADDVAGTELDLHRTLALGPFGLTLRLADLWDDYDVLTIGGTCLRALPREQRFLHACLHAALSGLPPRLMPLRDIAQMSSGKLDVDTVIELARSWQAEAVLLVAVELAWRVLQLDRSAGIFRRTRSLQPTRWEARAIRPYLSPQRSYVGLCVAAVQAIPRPSDKLRYLTALGFPSREFIGPRYETRLARWRSAAEILRTGRSGGSLDTGRHLR